MPLPTRGASSRTLGFAESQCLCLEMGLMPFPEGCWEDQARTLANSKLLSDSYYDCDHSASGNKSPEHSVFGSLPGGTKLLHRRCRGFTSSSILLSRYPLGTCFVLRAEDTTVNKALAPGDPIFCAMKQQTDGGLMTGSLGRFRRGPRPAKGAGDVGSRCSSSQSAFS